MGFLKSAANFVAEGAKKQKYQYERCRERYDRLDDERLMNRYKKASSSAEKLAASSLLKERGYRGKD